MSRDVWEGLAVLACIAVIVAGAFGLAAGLVRLAGPWAPILGGLVLMVLALGLLAVIAAVRVSRRKRDGHVDVGWHPDYGSEEYQDGPRH